MTRRIIELTIQKVRSDPEYHLDPEMLTSDVLVEAFGRITSLLRAQWKLIGVSGGKWRFVESGCSIKHRRHLTVGTGSVIEHGARFACLGRQGIHIGKRVTVGKYSLIECTSVLWNLGEGLHVGDGSSIGDYSFIGCAAGVEIGSDVLMGQRVSFHSQNHNFADIDKPIREQGVTSGKIVVGDDCWLGSGSIILSGVEIGAGSVVAAGSVVTKSFGPNSVIAGVPAQLIKVRGRADQEPVDASPALD